MCSRDLKGTLDIWDMQMVEYGRRIIEKRKRFVEELNEIIQNIHFNLTGGTENLRVIYEPSCRWSRNWRKLFLKTGKEI